MLDSNSQNLFYTSGYYRNIYSTKNNWEENLKDELILNVRKKPSSNKPNFNKYYDLLFFDYINNLELDFNSVFEVGAKVGLNLIYFKNLDLNILVYTFINLFLDLSYFFKHTFLNVTI